MTRRDVVILGSTGSIGTQALEVVAANRDQLRVVALAAGGSRPELLGRQVREFRPKVVAVAGGVAQRLDGVEVLVGEDAPAQVAAMFPDATVLNGIDGAVGLASTLSALEAGATLALANKESLVAGATLVASAMRRPGQIVPVDSEHSAIAQAMKSGTHNRGLCSVDVDGRSDLHSLVLTASGGPFRGRTRDQMRDVTADQALAHPTWQMGPTVTVNSSTLMNKALELIEACVLFDVPPEAVTPVIHPQSVVHSMVTWRDGSTVAQASYPDMRVPIAMGLSAAPDVFWPDHLKHVGQVLRWNEPTAWTFEPVDESTFPALSMARESLAASQTHPAVMNAANEVAVQAFLANQIQWLAIQDTVRRVLESYAGGRAESLGAVLEAQDWARARAREILVRESA